MACWVCAVFCIVRPPFFVQRPNPTWRCALSWNRRWSTDGAVHSCGEKTKALAPSKGEPLSQVCVSVNHVLLLSHFKDQVAVFPISKMNVFRQKFSFLYFQNIFKRVPDIASYQNFSLSRMLYTFVIDFFVISHNFRDKVDNFQISPLGSIVITFLW